MDDGDASGTSAELSVPLAIEFRVDVDRPHILIGPVLNRGTVPDTLDHPVPSVLVFVVFRWILDCADQRRRVLDGEREPV